MALVSDGTYAVIDTGMSVRRIGEGADHSWFDELEMEDGGEFVLSMTDGRTKLAQLLGHMLSGVESARLLEQMNVMSEDDALEAGASVLHVDMVRVSPEARGRGYAVRLLRIATQEFRSQYVWAQLFSQRVYRSFRAVLPEPIAMAAGTHKYGDDEPLFEPTDDDVNEQLDEEPVESQDDYKSVGYKLSNKRYVKALWRK